MIPEYVFIVAACNPHRGNSLAIHEERSQSYLDQDWIRSTYYVRQLHPTLDLLKWDYGSLDEEQEGDYILAKMKLLNIEESHECLEHLTDMIVSSQKEMRKYALEHLKSMSREADDIAAKSCVSQRDIQRVFKIFLWLKKLYNYFPKCNSNDSSQRAVLVSLGIVYFMRLNAKYRERYEDWINESYELAGEVNFQDAFQEELEWFISKIELPPGIAPTQSLMENLLATVVCTSTRIPLIIVGAPGSSKTLSFNIAIDSMKGQESKVGIFRETNVFHSLDPHFYQCSRKTTSNEVETIFSRAINRQRSYFNSSLPIICVVFMDEAGLPEESHESLKALHYYLDRQEVSFVAITNHMLDAAKTNRAVCLFRSNATEADLKILAKGCFSSKWNSSSPQHNIEIEYIDQFCVVYSDLMKKPNFSSFFGLRDFIHFITYLRRKQTINKDTVMKALERNFNGCEEFEDIANKFLKKVSFLTVL